jgi:hypothetical protein
MRAMEDYKEAVDRADATNPHLGIIDDLQYVNLYPDSAEHLVGDLSRWLRRRYLHRIF